MALNYVNTFYLKGEKLRSSHQRCSIKKGVLRNFVKLTRKHLRQIPFFNKVAGLLGLWYRCFPVNFANFYEHLFTEHLWLTAFKSSDEHTLLKNTVNEILLSNLDKLSYFQVIPKLENCLLLIIIAELSDKVK